MTGFREIVTEEVVELSFKFEILFPQFIKFYLGRRLKRYQKRGFITGYEVKAGRIGKYHYIFEIDLDPKIPKGGET